MITRYAQDAIAIAPQLITLLLSIGAFGLAFRTFKRQATFENENYIFKHKVEKSNEVLAVLAEHMTEINRDVEAYYDYLVDPDTEVDNDKVLKMKDDFFERIGNVERVLTSKIVFLPRDVVKLVLGYIDFVYDANFINCDEDPKLSDKKVGINTTRDYANLLKLDDRFSLIADAMRDDSKVEELHGGLQSRLGKERKQSRMQTIIARLTPKTAS